MTNKTKTIISVGLVVVGLSVIFSGVASNYSSRFLKATLAKDLSILGTMYALKSLVTIAQSIEVDAEASAFIASGGIGANIGAGFAPLGDVLDKGINFFAISNAIIAVLMVLVMVGKTVLFKVLVGLAALGLAFRRLRRVALNILVLLVMLNPGLPLYVIATEIVYKHGIPDTSDIISEKVTTVKDNFQEMLESDGILGKSKGFMKAIQSVVTESISGLMEVLVVFLASSVILFFVLPIGYYYVLRIGLRAVIERVNADFGMKIKTPPELGELMDKTAEMRERAAEVMREKPEPGIA